jgi:hypothetical protein
MAKSYSQFSYEDLENLGIIIEQKPLFDLQTIVPITPSETLEKVLKFNLRRPLGSEKAKSELLITPVLNELVEKNQETINYFSGYTFDVDKEHGLKGQVDFIISKSPMSPTIKAPIFCIVEAKNDNLDVGVPQCIAEMFASQAFNQKRGQFIPVVYGAVTFGLAWQFLRLEGQDCVLDSDIYYLNNLPQLIGILQFIVQNS